MYYAVTSRVNGSTVVVSQNNAGLARTVLQCLKVGDDNQKIVGAAWKYEGKKKTKYRPKAGGVVLEGGQKLNPELKQDFVDADDVVD